MAANDLEFLRRKKKKVSFITCISFTDQDVYDALKKASRKTGKSVSHLVQCMVSHCLVSTKQLKVK